MIKSVTYNNNNQTDNDTNDNVNYSSVCFHVIFLETIIITFKLTALNKRDDNTFFRSWSMHSPKHAYIHIYIYICIIYICIIYIIKANLSYKNIRIK